jgi:hypothetical protein
MVCHAPSFAKEDLVRGFVPSPGEEPPPAYGKATDGLFIRADITYLRQDFSVVQPVLVPGKWPGNQRYDYVLRTRKATPTELRLYKQLQKDNKLQASYQQQEAVKWAVAQLKETPADPSPAPKSLKEPAIELKAKTLRERFPEMDEPKAHVIRDVDFKANLAAYFPLQGNLARSGKAEVVNGNAENPSPAHLLEGHRQGQASLLGAEDGAFHMHWSPNARGRFILLFAGPSAYGSDAWGDAVATVNGGEKDAKVIELPNVSGKHVVLIDLGRPMAIERLRIQVRKSLERPGLTGVEIH